MKSEIATAGRKKNIPDPGQLKVTLEDVSGTLFRQGTESGPVSKPCVGHSNHSLVKEAAQVSLRF